MVLILICALLEQEKRDRDPATLNDRTCLQELSKCEHHVLVLTDGIDVPESELGQLLSDPPGARGNVQDPDPGPLLDLREEAGHLAGHHPVGVVAHLAAVVLVLQKRNRISTEISTILGRENTMLLHQFNGFIHDTRTY